MQLGRLREFRESQGLMQRELAQLAGTSEFTVMRAENGVSIRPNTARKLANALGLSVADLMEDPPVPKVRAPRSGQAPKVTKEGGTIRVEATDAAGISDDVRLQVRQVLVDLHAHRVSVPEALARVEAVLSGVGGGR